MRGTRPRAFHLRPFKPYLILHLFHLIHPYIPIILCSVRAGQRRRGVGEHKRRLSEVRNLNAGQGAHTTNGSPGAKAHSKQNKPTADTTRKSIRCVLENRGRVVESNLTGQNIYHRMPLRRPHPPLPSWSLRVLVTSVSRRLRWLF